MKLNINKNTIKKMIRLLEDSQDAEVTDFDHAYYNIIQVIEILENWIKGD
ncbi:MAG: hypothetical protein MJ180_00080 [Candidatus Gastranaerophilales bacterium]|nr:hypothetical protein [Candidatus Gastranaerophilales bacterium]